LATTQPIPFAFSLDQLGPAGVVQAYSTLELGALYRMARHSWESDRPGELPDCDIQLSLITQTRAEEWQAMRPRLLLSFRPEHQQGSGASLLVNRTLRDLHASAVARRNQQAPSGPASALARAGPDQRTFNGRSTDVERAFNERSGAPASRESRAPAGARGALQRKEIQLNQERGGAAPEQDVAGVIMAGQEARAQARLVEWRSTEARRLVAAAFARWARDWRVRPGADLAGRIARYPHVTPALAEIAIGRADAWLESGRATPRADRDGPNPVGYLIKLMACCRGAKQPIEPHAWDQPVLDKWAALERKVFDAEQAMQAMQAGLMRIDRARQGQANTGSADVAERRAALEAAIKRSSKEIAS